jgi:hypothetical protein
MKRIVMLSMACVMMLVSLAGCFWWGYEGHDGRGGGGHDSGGDRGGGGGGGGHDSGGGHEERH